MQHSVFNKLLMKKEVPYYIKELQINKAKLMVLSDELVKQNIAHEKGDRSIYIDSGLQLNGKTCFFSIISITPYSGHPRVFELLPYVNCEPNEFGSTRDFQHNLMFRTEDMTLEGVLKMIQEAKDAISKINS